MVMLERRWPGGKAEAQTMAGPCTVVADRAVRERLLPSMRKSAGAGEPSPVLPLGVTRPGGRGYVILT